MIDIGDIRKLAENKANIEMSLHMLERCRQRNIRFADIENVLKNGEIIEQYPNDYPFPSCLELGCSLSGLPMHVCCGIGNNKIWLITAYYPEKDKWEDDMKTRKAVN